MESKISSRLRIRTTAFAKHTLLFRLRSSLESFLPFALMNSVEHLGNHRTCSDPGGPTCEEAHRERQADYEGSVPK